MAHSHAQKNKCKLAVMFTLNFGFFLVELIVGYMTNSMALVADSFHMLSDVAALVVAFFAVKMSPKKWSKNTFGWARAEVLGALVNSVFLVALCFSISVESIKRFITPEPIEDPLLILIVGTIGLVMNLVGLCIFRHPHSHSHHHHHPQTTADTVLEEVRTSLSLTHSNRVTRMVSSAESSSTSESDFELSTSDSDAAKGDAKTKNVNPKPKSHGGVADQMNIRGVFLHLMADALGSVIVIISALIFWLTDWEYKLYVDPTLSVIMVVLILISVYPLLQESSLILLQTVPTHIKVDELESKLTNEIDGVLGIHELHIAGDRIIATAHINFTNLLMVKIILFGFFRCRNLEEYFQIAGRVKELFHNEGIHSTTIQPEFSQQSPALANGGDDCYLSCSTLTAAPNCSKSTCCGPLVSDATASDHNAEVFHNGDGSDVTSKV
ncbi:Zinc transporter 1 [Orchesella cincta]|uniref:Zinc transporter 1 n=1 Tax=Orchesella cincta TaxID=48709 RepID=A0A1D2M690_ORCCI|nr:Zinc transporter 1 [Orchesella cincta]